MPQLDPSLDDTHELDVSKEREAFKLSHGMTPEDWLDLWRADKLPHTGINERLSFHAALIETSWSV